MTVFMWANGSPFEEVLGQYTSAAFPDGIDPNSPSSLHTLGTFNASSGIYNNAANATTPVDTA